MPEHTDLPEDVIEALRKRRVITAIKRLREARGIGLRDAKEAIEAYAREHPGAHDAKPELEETGTSPLFVVFVLAFLGYLAYQFAA